MQEYKIIQTATGKSTTMRDDFEKLVNAALAEGWTCQGGVFVSGSTFYQAMVKDKQQVLNG